MAQMTELLARFPLFAGLSAAALAAVAAAIEERQLAVGGILFRVGDAADGLYLVIAGTIVASRRDESGREFVLHRLGPGDVAGITGIFIDKPRSATLRADTDAQLAFLPKSAVQTLLQAHGDLGLSLIRFLSQRYRNDTAGTPGDSDGIAVFDTKPYDRIGLSRHCPAGLSLRFLEARLDATTARLAEGCRVAIAFVNDRIDAAAIAVLREAGVGLLALRCAGYNNVDLAAAHVAGLTVTRVPAYSPHAVAEHAMALLLTLNRKTHRAWARVREGDFQLAGLVGFDLHGKTMAVLGTGTIGRCLVRIARGFGMTVLGWDLHPDARFAAETGLRYAPLTECLEAADVVSLHTPLTPATHHLIDAAALARMRDSAILINTGRGGLVDTEALVAALTSGRLAAAGLDVYEEEAHYFFEDHRDRPIRDEVLARLISLPNVLVTSHQAFLTREALDNIATTTMASITAFLAGETLVHRVE